MIAASPPVDRCQAATGPVSPAGHHAVGAVTASQKRRNWATRFSGGLPAMISGVVAPIEIPATQSGK